VVCPYCLIPEEDEPRGVRLNVEEKKGDLTVAVKKETMGEGGRCRDDRALKKIWCSL